MGTVECQQKRKIRIGAIRWDAWIPADPYGKGTDVGGQVARALNPAAYRNRAPYFSVLDCEGNLDFPEYTMQILEEEMEFAVQAGIDYWAYCWYLDSSPMSVARKLHLQSAKRNSLPMCAILGVVNIAETEYQQLFNAMKQECYVRIGCKPLVFIYGGMRQMGEKGIKRLREEAEKNGLPPLYIVSMVSSGKPDSLTALSSGYDALSFYSYPVSNGTGPLTYAALARKAELRNEHLGAEVFQGAPVQIIPSVTAGRDIRPRLDHPVTWAPDYGADNYALAGAPAEIAKHLSNTLEWTGLHPEATVTDMVVIYAWNEHDEGGWLCPTIQVDEKGHIQRDETGRIIPDTSQLDAVKAAISAFRKKEEMA